MNRERTEKKTGEGKENANGDTERWSENDKEKVRMSDRRSRRYTGEKLS